VFGRTKVEGMYLPSPYLGIYTDKLGVDGGQFVVSDKTISRQHLIVEVAPVGPSDCVCRASHLNRLLKN
jgi:hypothetical protein